jgi:hypothetical protein
LALNNNHPLIQSQDLIEHKLYMHVQMNDTSWDEPLVGLSFCFLPTHKNKSQESDCILVLFFSSSILRIGYLVKKCNMNWRIGNTTDLKECNTGEKNMTFNIFFKGHNNCNPLVTQHLISHTCSAPYFTHMVKLYFHIDIKVFILVNLIRIKSLHLLLIFVSVLY